MNEHIHALVAQYLGGTIDKTGYLELLQYFRLDEDTEQLDQLLYEAIADETREAPLSEDELEDVTDAAYQRIQRRIARPKRTVWRLLPYAAAILIMAGVGAWLFFSNNKQQTTDNGLAAAAIAPGGNRATLTLADGRTVDLSEAQSGIIIGEEINYTDGSAVLEQGAALTEQGEGSPHGTENGKLTTNYYVLSTPKGGQYQITLPDGSRVWLNAASTLKYPSRFSGDERIVELIGEGYFEVNRRKSVESVFQPFKVITSGQTIEVLGTEFNVTAYADEEATTTTLVEGSVQILNLASNIINKLSPREQSIVREAHTEIANVNVSQYTAWRSGLFHFGGEPLEAVLRQVARWYDVEVVFADDALRTIPVEGIVDRYDQLSTLLRVFESVGDIHFQIKGRTLIVGHQQERSAPM